MNQMNGAPRSKSVRPWRLSVLVVAVTTCSLALSACGSSSKKATASNTTAQSPGSTQPSGAPLVIGSIITQTGQGSAIFSPARGVMNAWAQWTNAHGGINGHPVKVDILDDQNTPSLGLSAAHTLVQGDHIVALVGSADNSGSGWGPYLSQQKIPIIGSGGSVAIALTGNSDYYSPGLTYSLSKPLELAVAKKEGDKVIGGIYCAEATACLTATKLTASAATSLGLTVVKEVEVSATSSSYVAPCLTLKQAGAQAITLATDTGTQQKFVDTCAQQGYYPLYLGDAGTITSGWTSDPAYKNAGGVLDEFPWWDTTKPAVAQFQEALQKYDPAGLKSPTIAAEVWASAMVFEDGAKAAQLGSSPTAGDIVTGLNTLSNDTLGGLVSPITYANGNRTNKCGYQFVVQSGSFKLLNNGQPACSS